ncbi:MAG: gliding motility lipoprotein GldH [Porphyromonadaceae bacterium]|nr:gliding motility lipoprotein GldH [Porphyromonadaceae bacterium]
MKISKLVIGLFLIVAFTACNQNEVYFRYNPIPTSGWDKDSLLVFDYNIEDTISKYDIFIHVRHFGNYPYQNFWLFLENTNPDSVVTKDTIECYLADQYGKWLGSGNAIKEMPIFYKQQILIPDTGNYQLKIGHGMRDSVLTGIKEIGVRVELVRQ